MTFKYDLVVLFARQRMCELSSTNILCYSGSEYRRRSDILGKVRQFSQTFHMTNSCRKSLTQCSMSKTITVGVLALQGAFIEHIFLLRSASTRVALADGASWAFIEVRTSQQLDQCDALIIPGGESTTVSLVAARSGLLDPLREFVKYVCGSSHCCPNRPFCPR